MSNKNENKSSVDGAVTIEQLAKALRIPVEQCRENDRLAGAETASGPLSRSGEPNASPGVLCMFKVPADEPTGVLTADEDQARRALGISVEQFIRARDAA